MKKLYIVLFCLPLICFGQTEYFQDYYESGQLKREGNLKENREEGLWRMYYESGQLKQEGNFIDGKQEGLWKNYYESGQLQQETNFILKGCNEVNYVWWNIDTIN